MACGVLVGTIKSNIAKIGKEIVGIYHTDPSYSPVPSLRDREFMMNVPFVWIIAGDYMMGHIFGTMGFN